MIVSSLEKRGDGSESFKKRKTLSTKVRRRDTNSSLQMDSPPEYFHLAVTDDPTTYLWIQRSFPYYIGQEVACVCLNQHCWSSLDGSWSESGTTVKQAGILKVRLMCWCNDKCACHRVSGLCISPDVHSFLTLPPSRNTIPLPHTVKWTVYINLSKIHPYILLYIIHDVWWILLR